MTCFVITLVNLLPESPFYHLTKNNEIKAKDSLKWYRGQTYDDIEIKELKYRVSHLEKVICYILYFFLQITINVLKNRYVLSSFFACFFAFLAQQLSGVNIMIFYALTLFNVGGSGDLTGSEQTVLIGGVQILSCFLAMCLIDVVGRRILLIVSSVLMGLFLILLGKRFFIMVIDTHCSSIIARRSTIELPITRLALYLRSEKYADTSYKEKYILSQNIVDDTNNKKKCINLRFIDSYKFLSLEKLASYLDKAKLKITRSEFFNLSAELFYSSLTISENDYAHAIEDMQHLHNAHTDLLFCSITMYSSRSQNRKNLSRIAIRNLRLCEYIEFNTNFRTLPTMSLKKIWDGRYSMEAMIEKPNFHSKSVFSENLVAVHRENCKVMYTNSLIYYIEYDNIYDINVISGFVDRKKDMKKAKAIKSNDIDRSCIRSKLHEVCTISETKIALSPYDEKRYIVSDSTDTLLWGHYKILLYNKKEK
ncbi:Facilitated trehalose transporter Tret1 [Atta colombica]|uniref:Facilitated trehalose transporter Tret1 n=1 Tax=Atta colombica TaxID=520822 RepID=A0A151HZQ7_9HYME|nr:Facilitated trehalose transporter Tret1 [Atta colombica]